MNFKPLQIILILLLVPTIVQAVVYFETDFETTDSYVVGNLYGQPDEGGTNWAGTNSAYIDIVSGQSVRLRDPGGSSHLNTYTISPSSEFEIEFEFQVNNTDAQTISIMQFRDGTTQLFDINCFNGDLFAASNLIDNTGDMCGDDYPTVHTIKLVVNDTANTYDVWYDGVEELTGLSFSSAGDLDILRFVGASVADSLVIWVDDLCVADDVDTECFVSGDTAPTISITTPSNGTIDTDGDINVSGIANDTSGQVANVTLYVNGTVNETYTCGGENCTWEFNLTGMPHSLNWYNLTVEAEDNATQTTNASVEVTQNVPPTGNVISSPTNASTMLEGQNYIELNYTATDSDSDTITYYLYNGSGCTGTPLYNGLLTTYNSSFGKNHNFSLKAGDSLENSSCSSVYVYYYNTTDVPTWNETILNQTIEYGDAFKYDVNASDKSGVDEYWLNDTSQFTINNSGYITNASTVALGTYDILISVNDTLNNILTGAINITVQDTTAPTWTEPITNQTISVGNTLSYDVNATDLTSITYSLNNTANYSINSGTGVITNASYVYPGVQTLTVTANDTSGNELNASFNITVTDVSYTSFKHFDIYIDNVTINSATNVLIHNSTTNLTADETVLGRGALNVRKASVPSTSTLYLQIEWNGNILFNNSVRTVDNTADYGIVNIPTINGTTVDENNTLVIYAREDGTGSVEITNFETHTIINSSTKNKDIGYNISTTEINFTDTTFTNVANVSYTKVRNTTMFIDISARFTANETATPACYIETETGERSTIFERHLSSGTDIGSSGGAFYDNVSRDGQKDYLIYCKTTTGSEAGLNLTTAFIDLMDFDDNLIQAASNTSSLTNYTNTVNLTAGTHKLTEVNSFDIKHGQHIEVISTVIFNSSSGTQTPQFFVNGNGSNGTFYLRYIADNTDVGTAKFYQSFDVTTGGTYSPALYVVVPTGETLTLIDEVILIHESTDTETTLNNIAPVVELINPDFNSTVTGENETINWTVTDVNLDHCDVMLLNTDNSTNRTLSGAATSPLTFNWSTVPIGTYNVKVNCTDTFGLLGEEIHTNITMVGTAPTFSPALTNQNVEYGASFSYDINATVTQGSVDEFSINDTSNFQIGSTTGILTNSSSVAVGTYPLAVTVNNSYGHSTTNNVNIIVQDTTAPTFNPAVTNQTVNYTLTFSYDVNATDLVGTDEFFLNDTSNFQVVAGTGVISNASTVPLGTYTLNLSVNDTSGNIAFVLFNITVQNNPPIITINSPANGTTYASSTVNVTVNFTVTDHDHFNCSVYFDQTPSPITLVQTQTNLTSGGFEYNSTGLVAGGDYYWYVTCADYNGSTTTTLTYTFSISSTSLLTAEQEAALFNIERGVRYVPAGLILIAILGFAAFAIWKIPDEHYAIKLLFFGFALFFLPLMLQTAGFMINGSTSDVQSTFGVAQWATTIIVICVMFYWVIGFLIKNISKLLEAKRKKKFGGQ